MEPLLQETLQSRDFSGEDLLKIQAEHCRFVSCIFEDALLEHCRFSGCVFRFCEFPEPCCGSVNCSAVPLSTAGFLPVIWRTVKCWAVCSGTVP